MSRRLGRRWNNKKQRRKMKLFLEKIKLSLQKRTKTAQTKKSFAAWQAKGYEPRPEATFIIQSHNKSLQVCHILPKLRAYSAACEIIVIDDGSAPAHTQRLTAALTSANDFLIRSNDLFENVTYDKAIRMANGRYIALLQDDDDFDGTQWIDRAIELFERHPRLAVLGGKDGLGIHFDHDKERAHGTAFEKQPTEGFAFVPAVNRAPMWLNRKLFTEYLHHIDFRFAPFQFDDYELCARTWLSGLQVGWYDAAFHSLSVGGMRLWNTAFTDEQSTRNGRLLYQLYVDRAEEIYRLVAEAQ